jgi:lipopolysaccharide export system permease protein
MKIIDRYVLRQYLIPLGYLLLSFSLLYVVLDLFDRFPDFVEAKIPLWDVVVYYGYYLFAVNGFVPFIVVVLPIALLLAALYTLTMFAQHNELTAMCASGVSLRRLMGPLLAVGFCASLYAAVTQETLGPRATRWISGYEKYIIKGQNEAVDIVSDYIYHTGVTRRQWLIGKFNQRDPGTMTGVKIMQERHDGTLETEILAVSTEWLDGTWWFHGLQTRPYNEQGEPSGPMSPPSAQPVEMTDYTETPAEFLGELQKTDFLSSLDMIRYLESRPGLSGAGRARRLVDIHARLAMPWSCMVMILLSVPAAAGGSRRPAMRSVAFGLAALFGFYFMINAGMILGKREIIWPWLAGWLPNLVFLGIGGVLTWRMK